MKKFVPVYEGELRKHSIQVPRCISECSGIRIFGRRIKSLVFSTDVAIIKNINADAVIAVYPFTPQPAITQAILSVSEVPVFAGVGGGLTNGQRSASIAAYAEHQGAFGLVCNAFITEEAIRAIKDRGLRVPEDISVIGFDGIVLSQYMCPRLTTIKQDSEIIARRSLEILLGNIREELPVTYERIPSLFIRGESTCALSEQNKGDEKK